MSKSSLEGLARAWELALRVENKRPATISRYSRDLGYFIRWPKTSSEAKEITADTVRSYLLDLRETHSSATIRGALLSISLFLRFLHQEGDIPSNPAANIKSPRVEVRPMPAYSRADVEALRLACSVRTAEGIRDRALILTLFSTGVRLGELLSMSMPDLERMRFTVSGKTGSREIPLGAKLAVELERYLRRWGIAQSPIWRSLKGGQPLSSNGVYQLIKRLCKRSGVKNLGVHAFRRSFAIAFKARSIQLGIGGDSDLMEIAGWKTVTMLKRYTASEANTLAHQAFAKLDPADTLSA